MAWYPQYDGNGKLLNSDPNIYTINASCATCGREWMESRRGDKVTISNK